MPVIPTDKWLRDYLNSKKDSIEENFNIQRECLCEKLITYFDDATSYDVHYHLLDHGLFLPDPMDTQVIERMIKNNAWVIIGNELEQLKNEWQGPDIPIFMFPSDFRNEQIRFELSGRSGLGYQDKLFMFVSSDTVKLALQALVTHEYNHVCRLNHLNQSEDNLTLLDAIVLEGLAERAVLERLGEDYLANWTSIYSVEVAEKYWERWLKPNLNLRKIDITHDDYLYGNGKIPKWIGYNVGYHLVSSYVKSERKSIDEVLSIPTKEILEGSDFSI